LDPDSQIFYFLDPDPHRQIFQTLNPDPQEMDADPEHCFLHLNYWQVARGGSGGSGGDPLPHGQDAVPDKGQPDQAHPGQYFFSYSSLLRQDTAL